MLRFGQKEIDAFAHAVRSCRLFRYDKDGQCGRFERRFGTYIGAEHVRLTASGTVALQAALAGLGIGPGDEVLVPAHTYMASALGVLGVGAIPVIVDVDESIMMDPDAMADAIGPRTRAVMPVHMWGLVCDMDRIGRIARRKKLYVVEDASQCVGGGYEGRMVGSLGDAAAFSFNYYKNMTCGEGGAVVCQDPKAAQRAECLLECCSFYWTGHKKGFRPFASVGSRASEFEGAILNAQLDRLGGMIRTCRRLKKRLLADTADCGLTQAPCHSLDGECGISAVYQLPTAEQAAAFAEKAGGVQLSSTGRHNYTEWDPILERRGSHHPALDPFQMPQNAGCRMNYTPEMCSRSLEIVSRSVRIALHPDMKAAERNALAKRIRQVAGEVLGH